MADRDLTILSTDGLGKELIKKPGTHNAFMILSPDQSYHSKKNIGVYCEWALKYCPRFLLYIFDTPHMYDFWAFKNLDPPEAKAKAETIGLEKERGFRKVIRRLRTDRIDIQRHSTFKSQKSWPEISRVLTEYLISDESFRKDITQDVLSVDWIRKKVEQNPQIIEGLTWQHYCESRERRKPFVQICFTIFCY
jgi:tRNA-dependent cyclodipeptide synthase